MDPKKKKIYIVIIIACIGLSVGVLAWGGVLGGGASQGDTGEINVTVTPTPEGDLSDLGFQGTTNYGSPSVFPATEKFEIEVLQSPAFLKLKPYVPVDATGLLGRPDPFRSY